MRLYLIRDGVNTGNAKVGLAQDVGKRLRQLQTGSPVRLYVQKSWIVPRHKAFAIERMVHARFGRWRLSGEWFDGFVVEDIIDYLDATLSTVGDVDNGYADQTRQLSG